MSKMTQAQNSSTSSTAVYSPGVELNPGGRGGEHGSAPEGRKA